MSEQQKQFFILHILLWNLAPQYIIALISVYKTTKKKKKSYQLIITFFGMSAETYLFFGALIYEPIIHMCLVTRKPVFGVSDQVRLKPACAATEAS